MEVTVNGVTVKIPESATITVTVDGDSKTVGFSAEALYAMAMLIADTSTPDTPSPYVSVLGLICSSGHDWIVQTAGAMIARYPPAELADLTKASSSASAALQAATLAAAAPI